jgi:hypothetical protein
MTIIEIVDADPKCERRMTNPRMEGRAIGIHTLDGARYLYLFEEGRALRMLSRREIKSWYEDKADDWRFSNQ